LNVKAEFDYLVENTDEEESLRLKRMSYGWFLRTDYWDMVSTYVKHMAGNKCVVCDAWGNLHAHHKRYDHRGYEHIYWSEDLVCLCNDCHKKIHFMIPAEKPKPKYIPKKKKKSKKR
jgi:5-methylcytosine-specific restriction endonuclease McrA